VSKYPDDAEVPWFTAKLSPGQSKIFGIRCPFAGCTLGTEASGG